MRYDFFTTNEIKPAGWIKRQLQIQSEGLAGNLDKVWPDVRDSKWIGGDCEGWERVPYWLDGFIPLAYLLEDEGMIKRAKRYIDAILEAQEEDGWICPCTREERAQYDTWAVLLITKVLALYYDCSKDARIPLVLEKVLKNLLEHLKEYPLFFWGKSRWYEGLVAIRCLYKLSKEKYLEDLAELLHRQGADFEEEFTFWKHAVPENIWTQETHVVNMAMALKSGAIFSLFSGDDPERLPNLMLETLRRDHGMAHGHFTGDECLSGKSPIQGSELCSVAEAMYSEEWILAETGGPQWADHLEYLAFNAFPATVSADMWSHQYDQQTNQIACVRESSAVYRTNGSESNVFGLEPNFGCCTANMGQAFPKFVLSSWMKGEKDTFINMLLVPTVFTTEVQGITLEITLETSYPFKNTLLYTVKCASPVKFTLGVRIPGFASKAKIHGKEAAPGKIWFKEKEWKNGDTVAVELDFDIVMEERPNKLYCVKRGPLLYALPIENYIIREEYILRGVERKFPYCDYELLPRSKWNYAFASRKFTFEEKEIGKLPFDQKTPPVILKGAFTEITWKRREGSRATVTEEPADRTPLTPVEEKILIPYACAKTRMTELPLADPSLIPATQTPENENNKTL